MFLNKMKFLGLFFLVIATVSVSGLNAEAKNSAVKHEPPLVDSDFEVDIYVADSAFEGTTLLGDNHRRNRPRIIEIDMQGRIVWEYELPPDMQAYTNPGFDVERLPGNTVLFVLPGRGIFEMDRKGSIVWSHLDPQVSHDADRLANGNTLYVFGYNDEKRDAQVKEVAPDGQLVWSWHAKDELDKPPFANAYDQGWTHTNAVTRMINGHTLISPRNFNCLVEVDQKGKVQKIIGEKYLRAQHDPAVLPNGHILLANHDKPHEILEIDPQTEAIVWRFAIPKRQVWPVRDADRLPNGNTLITGTRVLVEVTPDKRIVWRLKLKNVHFRSRREAPALGFYKCQRLGPK